MGTNMISHPENFELNDLPHTPTSVQDLSARIRDLENQLNGVLEVISYLKSRGIAAENNGFVAVFAADVGSVVGLREALTWGHRPLKAIWAILVMAGLAATIFYIYKNTQEYLNKEVASKMSLERKIAYEYPPLLICPPWWFNYDDLNSRGLSDEALVYSFGYSAIASTYLGDGPGTLLGNAYSLVTQKSATNDSRAMKQIHAISHHGREEFYRFYERQNYSSLVEYYKSIAIDVTKYDEDEEESENSTLHLHGCEICDQEHFQFKNKIIFNNAICYLVPLIAATANSSAIHADFRVSNSDHTRAVLSPHKLNWRMDFQSNVGPNGPSINLEAFSSYTVKVSAQRFIMLQNSSACVDTSSPSNSDYNQLSCVDTCISDQEAALGLNFSLVGNYGPGEVLNEFDIAENIIQFLPKFQAVYKKSKNGGPSNETIMELGDLLGANLTVGKAKGPSNQDVVDCYDKCLPACDRTVYDVTIARNEKIDQKGENRSEIKLQIKHSAVFQGGVMTLQEVNTLTFSEFVSNVGGTLGLFLGCTIMTLAQIILAIVNYKLDTRTPKDRDCDPANR